MRKSLGGALAVLLTLTAVTAADAAVYAPRVICGASCKVLQTDNAHGTVRVRGNGTAYGQVGGSSTIRIKDRTADGKQGFSVGGWSSRHKTSTGWWVFKGDGMSFLSENAFTLVIKGGSANTRFVVSGSAYLQGSSGRYQVNGGVWRRLTATGASITL
jgi:hypothetical protein